MPIEIPHLVELLWNERRVDSYDLTHRIAIPLAGHPLTRDAAHRLGITLDAWWASAPDALDSGVDITFVDVELRDEALAPRELVLTLTTSAPASAPQVANLRTIRDLRRAVRELQRSAVLVDQRLALAA